mmetsp:Transcript_50624/g.83988  ORF Transcript_50624/g.83988 Transcript_50624/m.83988 type:complete len:177 (-) Transcript_50624:94-624(-)
MPGFVQQVQMPCNDCGGTGKVHKEKCPHCKGKKVIPGTKTLEIVIERGMADGEKIVFKGQAEQSPDMSPGDMVFILKTQPNTRFRRTGDNLHYVMHISLLEALVGFEKPITHLDSHIVTVRRDRVTSPGDVITVGGEGMPKHKFPSERGDLFVELIIDFPNSVTSKQAEAFIRLLQ